MQRLFAVVLLLVTAVITVTVAIMDALCVYALFFSTEKPVYWIHPVGMTIVCVVATAVAVLLWWIGLEVIRDTD